MEEELNYLSEKIDALDRQVELYTRASVKSKDRLKRAYEKMVSDAKWEKQLLENILSSITNNVLRIDN